MPKASEPEEPFGPTTVIAAFLMIAGISVIVGFFLRLGWHLAGG